MRKLPDTWSTSAADPRMQAFLAERDGAHVCGPWCSHERDELDAQDDGDRDHDDRDDDDRDDSEVSDAVASVCDQLGLDPADMEIEARRASGVETPIESAARQLGVAVAELEQTALELEG